MLWKYPSLIVALSIILNSGFASTAWPSFDVASLPLELKETREIMEAVVELEINEFGYLTKYNVREEAFEEASLVEKGPEDWLVRTLQTAPLYGGILQWVVVLQQTTNRLPDDPYMYAHFSVSEDGITQTRKPGEEGIPRVIWQLPQVNWEEYGQRGQPFVYSAFDISQEYPKFSPTLIDLYEVKIGIHQRALVVKVDGNPSQNQKLTSNLLSLLWALREYNISPWEVLDNLEVYGHNGERARDLGAQTTAKLRFYLGVLALIQGDEEDKELYFGPFLKEEEDRHQAVENYFSSIRHYLMRVITPEEVQKWDSEVGYWFFHDTLFSPENEGIPLATYFAPPIPEKEQSPGGCRHLWPGCGTADGEEEETFHIGVDLNVGSGNGDIGYPFSSIANGRVVFSGRVANGMGNVIIVEHRLPNGSRIFSRYAHLDEIFVELGEVVDIYQTIGTVGRSGGEGKDNFYAHLHLDLAYSETYERFMEEEPQYYPNADFNAASRGFANPLEFINERLAPESTPVEEEDWESSLEFHIPALAK